MLNVNPASGIPIYRQIVDQIRRLIESGQLQAGDELPSVRQVAGTHTVNPMTVSKAYSLLETEGLLDRQRGKPMRVAASVQPRSDRQRRIDELRPALNQIALEARQLGLESEEVVDALIETLREKAA